MSTKILTATVTQVSIGHLSIEGLMDENAAFYVAAPQAADLFQFDKNQASRGLKSLLGKGFQFAKLKTPLNPKAVNAVTIAQFEKVMIELALKGNDLAAQMVRDLVGLSLHQLFCDAFEIKFDADDRQEFLKLRQESKALFWDLTEQIKTYIKSHQHSAPDWTYYSNAFDCINRSLFGLTSKQIRAELDLGDRALNRDHFGGAALRHICQVQQTAAKKMQKDPDLKPCDAVKMVVSFNEIEPMNFRA